MSQQTPGSTAMQAPQGDAFENLSQENRRFAPSAEFAANAVVTAADYAEADADRPAFWAKQARELLSWSRDFTQALDWSNPPFAKWFVGGEVNAAYNALDRHVEAGHGDRVAIYFEGEPGDTRTYTYAQLTEEVKKAANAFESLGVAKGDRVAVYLPMIPEAVITLLACARIGAIHSVVFGGFSAEALRSRIDDAEAKLVVTADGTYRRGKPSALKPAVDEALAHEGDGAGHTVQNVVVVRRNGAGGGLARGPGPLVGRHRRRRLRRAHRRRARRRTPALHPLHLRHHGQAQGHPAHHRRLPHPGRLHAQGRLRPAPGDRRVLVHRRRRLDHRALLRRLRPADQRRHPGHVRGHPGLPAPGPLVGDRGEVQGLHPLHRPHRDPHLHEVGQGHPGQVRPLLDPGPRLRGRTHQPGSLDVVPRGHRERRQTANARRSRHRSWTPGGRPRPGRR